MGFFSNIPKRWDEDNVRWLAYDKEEAQGSFRWDATNLEWASL